jgi:hypothetical protein
MLIEQVELAFHFHGVAFDRVFDVLFPFFSVTFKKAATVWDWQFMGDDITPVE